MFWPRKSVCMGLAIFAKLYSAFAEINLWGVGRGFSEIAGEWEGLKRSQREFLER